MGKKEPEVPLDAFKKTELPVNDPRTLVLALSSPELDVCRKACEALDAFANASDKNKTQLIEIGALPPLAKLLSSDVDHLRNLSSMCLSRMTSFFDCRMAMRGLLEDYFTPLVTMLGPSAGGISHENATATLANLCLEYSARVELAGRGGVELLVKLLAGPEPETQRNALKALSLMLDEYDCRARFGACGGVEALMALFSANYTELQQHAMIALAACAKNDSNRALLRDNGALEKIVDFLTNKDFAKAHSWAFKALGSLLGDLASLQRLCEPGLASKEGPTPSLFSRLTPFFTPLPSAADPEVQVNLLLALSRAAQSDDARRLLGDLKIEAQLIPLSLSEDPKNPTNPRVSLAATIVLAALSQRRSNSDAMVRGGLLGRLAKLLRVEGVDLVLHAAMTAGNILSFFPSNIQAFEEAAPVVALLKHKNQLIQTHGCRIVRFYPQDEDALKSCKSAGAISALHMVLTSPNNELQISSLNALIALCANREFREEFSSVNGISTLHGLMTHADGDVRNAALRLVSVCTVDPSIAQQFSDLGGLQTLFHLEHQVAVYSPFTTHALNTVLNSHLSAKFALRDELSVADTLAPFFYDAGHVEGDKIPVFKQLVEAEFAPLARVVYYINLGGSQDVPVDDALKEFSSSVWERLSSFSSVKEKVAAIAVSVSDRFGGSVAHDRVASLGVEIHLAELRKARAHNALPLGEISKGGYHVRALAFKLLCDQASIASFLIRGPYQRSYNVVAFPDRTLCVVDLMQDPGKLFPIHDLSILRSVQRNFFLLSH